MANDGLALLRISSCTVTILLTVLQNSKILQGQTSQMQTNLADNLKLLFLNNSRKQNTAFILVHDFRNRPALIA